MSKQKNEVNEMQCPKWQLKVCEDVKQSRLSTVNHCNAGRYAVEEKRSDQFQQ